MIEIIQMWAALESMAARLATQRASDEEVATLRRMFDRFESSSPEDVGDHSDAIIAFHTAVISLGGCQVIVDATRELLGPVRLICRRTITHGDGTDRSMTEHLRIIEALERRDTELAERLTRQHALDLVLHVDRLFC
jgi:DNA-binding GntR family transcriptional regulator